MKLNLTVFQLPSMHIQQTKQEPGVSYLICCCSQQLKGRSPVCCFSLSVSTLFYKVSPLFSSLRSLPVTAGIKFKTRSSCPSHHLEVQNQFGMFFQWPFSPEIPFTFCSLSLLTPADRGWISKLSVLLSFSLWVRGDVSQQLCLCIHRSLFAQILSGNSAVRTA